MPIVRAPRPQSNFYMLDKKISEDKHLSWAARGLLVFLLGKPDHWRVSVQALVNETDAAVMPSGRDAVYRILRELQQVGYVNRAQSKSNGGTFSEVDYVVSECRLEPLTENPEAAPLTALPHTDQPHTANPTLVSTDTSVSIENGASTEVHGPAVEPSAGKKKRERKTPVSLQSFLDDNQAKGIPSITAEDPIYEWADKTHVPYEMLEICWGVFKERFVEVPAKKQADWRAHFRNAVKGNWFHLWFFDAEGVCRLNTAGEQARRQHGVNQPHAPVRLNKQESLEARNGEVARRWADGAGKRDGSSAGCAESMRHRGPPRRPSRHGGFDQIDYREGVNPDGSF